MRAFVIAASLAATCAVAAAEYPAKPIRLVIPFPAGGTTDVAARVIAQPLSQALGQPIVIDYKPGADTVIAGDAVARSAPDGYTLLFGTASGFSFAPAVRKSMPYDPIADFTPISRIGLFGFFVYVHDGVPARSLAELTAHARANPGALNYGSTTATSQVATAQFVKAAGLDITHVPYKGDAPMLTDLLAGRVQVSIAAGAALPHVKNGKLRVLATMLPARSPLLPDVPTLAESGVPPVTVLPWAGLFGPAKMPRAVVDRLSRELSNVLAQPEVHEQLGRLALDARGSSADELAALVREQLVVWREAVRSAGLQPE